MLGLAALLQQRWARAKRAAAREARTTAAAQANKSSLDLQLRRMRLALAAAEQLENNLMPAAPGTKGMATVAAGLLAAVEADGAAVRYAPGPAALAGDEVSLDVASKLEDVGAEAGAGDGGEGQAEALLHGHLRPDYVPIAVGTDAVNTAPAVVGLGEMTTGTGAGVGAECVDEIGALPAVRTVPMTGPSSSDGSSSRGRNGSGSSEGTGDDDWRSDDGGYGMSSSEAAAFKLNWNEGFEGFAQREGGGEGEGHDGEAQGPESLDEDVRRQWEAFVKGLKVRQSGVGGGGRAECVSLCRECSAHAIRLCARRSCCRWFASPALP
jgi:hypothetical protein